MSQESVGYTLTIFGGTVTVTATDILQIVGLIGMIAGLILTFRGQQLRLHEHEINRERTAEMRRSNDLKERELCQNKKL